MAVRDVPSELHRLSPEEYRRLGESGVFDEDARGELLGGLLVDMSPKSRAHENAVAWLNRVLVQAINHQRFEVRVASPLTIGASEPEPDLAVIALDAPRPHHPATAELVVEVASSSRQRDLREKPPVYAGASVPRYWVADLETRTVVVHGEPAAGGYSSVDPLEPGGKLVAEDLGVAIDIAELFAAAAR